MNKFMLSVLTSFLLLFSMSIFAEESNENYLQIGYTSSDYKHADKITNVSGSLEFGNNYSLWGSYYRETGDWNDPGEYETLTNKKMLIGFGKSFPISPSTDIVTSLSYDKWDYKRTRQATGSSLITNHPSDFNFTEASIGVRNLTSSGIEISLENSWSRLRGTSKYYYYTPSIELKFTTESELETSLKLSQISKFGSNEVQTRMELEVIKPVSENLAIGGRFLSVVKPKLKEYGIFVRRSF